MAEDAADLILDRTQADHLPAQLGETRVAVHDGEEAVRVQMALISGLVPALTVQLDHHIRGLRRIVEIALHHLDAADQDEPVLARRQGLQGRGVDDAEAGAGQRQAHGAGTRARLDLPGRGLERVRDVDAGDRRGLRRSVALVDRLVELEREGVAHLRGKPFRTGDHHAYGLEHQRMDALIADIEPQEGRGAAQHGRTIAGDRLGGADRIGRVGMADHRDALEQRQEGGHREPEGMKGRQVGEDEIVRLGVEHVRDLAHVGHDVAMAELDPLGRDLAAAGEEDGGGIVGTTGPPEEPE